MIAISGRSRLGGFSEASIASASACGTSGASAVAVELGRVSIQPPKPANPSSASATIPQATNLRIFVPSELAAPWAADQERYLSAPGSTNPLARALAEMSKGCSAHPARAAALFRRRLRGETAVFFQEGDDLVHSDAAAKIGEEERRTAALALGVRPHHLEVRADVRSKVHLVDDQQVGPGNPRPALARNLFSG